MSKKRKRPLIGSGAVLFANQLEGFNARIIDLYGQADPLYRAIYKTLLKMLNIRGTTKDYFTAYQIGIWDAYSEDTVRKHLKMMHEDGFFNHFSIKGPEIYIDLKILY